MKTIKIITAILTFVIAILPKVVELLKEIRNEKNVKN